MRSAAQIRDWLVDYLAVVDSVADVELGDELKSLREAADALEAVSARLLYRFDKSREYASKGHPSAASWMRANCRMTGASAAQRVSVARSLAELPQTQSALANAVPESRVVVRLNQPTTRVF
jgi:hypothetical protein